MPCTDWSKLNHLQLGRYAEYYAKMEFASYGFEVFSSEVDDRGVDFICRKDSGFYEIQVKALRGTGYAYMLKKDMSIEHHHRYICLLRFVDNCMPEVYLIPATAWKNETPLLRNKDYTGLKSEPEWGINLSKRNLPLLQEFEFSKVLTILI